MTGTIKVAAAQYPIEAVANFAAWQTKVGRWVENATLAGSNLLLFPEYAAMELSAIEPSTAGDLKGSLQTVISAAEAANAHYRALAMRFGVTILASSMPTMLGNGRVVNRATHFVPDGRSCYQDKNVMTRFEREQWDISGGDTLRLFRTTLGPIGISICYDVEFPIGSQLLASEGAQLIVAPSCTETIRGATRVHIGARARALENQIYTAVAQTVGNALWSPAVDINYGYAAFYATPDKNLPEEGIISLGETQKPTWHYQTLDFELVDQVRADGQVFNFRDQQGIATKLLYHKVEIKKVQV